MNMNGKKNAISRSTLAVKPGVIGTVTVKHESGTDDYVKPSVDKASEDCDDSVRDVMSCACLVCPLRFPDVASLLEHSKAHARTYTCPVENTCGDSCSFSAPQDLNEHFLQNHCDVNENRNYCLLCEKPFTNERALLTHIGKQHTGVRQHQCRYCWRSCDAARDLTIHERRHCGNKPYVCRHCQRAFVDKRVMLAHETTHSDRPHKCDQCDKSFSRAHLLQEHRKLHVADSVGERMCGVCKKVLGTTRSLQRHMQIHSTFKCTQCDQRFTKRQDFQFHLLTHKGLKGFECEHCKKVFSTKCDYKQHFKMHSNTGDVRCTVCSKVFKTEKYLKVHMRLHTGTEPHCCTVCDRKFNSSSKYKQHMLRHKVVAGDEKPVTGDEKPVICDEKPFACDVCSKRFSSTYSLKLHARLHNADGMPFKCSSCDKRFNQRAQLHAHFNCVHLNVRDHLCNLCDKRFVTKHALKKHLVVHSGEKPYKCDVCARAFAQYNARKQHMLLRHSDKMRSTATVTQHACKLCNKVFGRKQNLQKHLNSHASRGVFTCHVCARTFKYDSFLQAHIQKKHYNERDVDDVHNASEHKKQTDVKIEERSESDEVIGSSDHVPTAESFSLTELARLYTDPVDVGCS